MRGTPFCVGGKGKLVNQDDLFMNTSYDSYLIQKLSYLHVPSV